MVPRAVVENLCYTPNCLCLKPYQKFSVKGKAALGTAYILYEIQSWTPSSLNQSFKITFVYANVTMVGKVGYFKYNNSKNTHQMSGGWLVQRERF